jgi:serine/threonine protein kinase
MIVGNYEIIRHIADGGFGRTYEGRHIYLDIKACLKQNSNISKADIDLFKREANIMADINHHSLPAFRDFFPVEDGSYILAMQFIEGKNLQEIITDAKQKKKQIKPETICWMSQRLLNALHYLHHKGIVHGDVKPGNIIIQSEDHNAILVDYGLSSLKPKKHTRPDGYTHLYAAPEIKNHKPPLPESDFYSFGLSMLAALGGDPISKTFPDYVPDELQDYYSDLIRYNPLDRPKWEDNDLVRKLSDLRQDLFGRRKTI